MIVKFSGEEAKALKKFQELGINLAPSMGINLRASQIGSYDKGEPDGVFGPGTFSFAEQLLLLAQKSSNITNPSKTYNLDSITLIERYLIKQGATDQQIAETKEALKILDLGNPDSQFSKTYKQLAKEKHDWRVDTAALSLPQAVNPLTPAVSVVRKKDAALSGEEYIAYADALDKNTRLVPKPPATDNPIIIRTAFTMAAEGGAQPAIYRPAANQQTTIKMTYSDYEALLRVKEPTEFEAAKIAAYKPVYEAALRDKGYNAAKARHDVLADLMNNHRAHIAELQIERTAAVNGLNAADKAIREKPITLTVDGVEHRTTIAAVLQIHGAESRFFELNSTTRLRDAALKAYNDMKNNDAAYKKHAATIKNVDQDFHDMGTYPQASANLARKMEEIKKTVQDTYLKISIPKDIPGSPTILAQTQSRQPTLSGVLLG